MKIPVKAILPNPDQPRQQFGDQELKELAQSIKRHSLINAVAVEDAGAGSYILVDGERRLRAHAAGVGWTAIARMMKMDDRAVYSRWRVFLKERNDN